MLDSLPLQNGRVRQRSPQRLSSRRLDLHRTLQERSFTLLRTLSHHKHLSGRLKRIRLRSKPRSLHTQSKIQNTRFQPNHKQPESEIPITRSQKGVATQPRTDRENGCFPTTRRNTPFLFSCKHLSGSSYPCHDGSLRCRKSVFHRHRQTLRLRSQSASTH